MSLWDLGAGGFIIIIGRIDFPDATTDIATGTTLLQGTFDSTTVIDVGSGTFEFQILGGAFTDTKHPELLAFYGLPDIGYVGGLNISFRPLLTWAIHSPATKYSQEISSTSRYLFQLQYGYLVLVLLV